MAATTTAGEGTLKGKVREPGVEQQCQASADSDSDGQGTRATTTADEGTLTGKGQEPAATTTAGEGGR